MPIQDAHRWNERYRENKHFSTFNSPRAFLIEHADLLPKQGLALDAAMGLGGNAGFLLERGLKVIGVDISEVAVRQAKARLPELMAVEADLTQFYLPDNTFDVIINFFYLQRDLWPQYVRALRPGGWLVLETLTHPRRRGGQHLLDPDGRFGRPAARVHPDPRPRGHQPRRVGPALAGTAPVTVWFLAAVRALH